jgi:hypothetical protein
VKVVQAQIFLHFFFAELSGARGSYTCAASVAACAPPCAAAAARRAYCSLFRYRVAESVTCCSRAAFGGHLHVLKWAREHDCPWNTDTCYYAVEGGHLHVLKWAREHGCPWNAATRDAAAAKGYSDSLPLSA